MHIWGLHVLDLSIIILYVIVILWLGKRASDKTTGTEDFFLAGRKLGKFYQFFLNFGCSTNADQAVAVSREIYRQGIGGMWIQFLVLFLTPFYWFTTLLFRRVRLITIGDYFTERFDSKFLGGSYAVFILLLSILGGGVGYMVAAKTMMAMTPKTIEICTVEERRSIEEFHEYKELKTELEEGLSQEKQDRYDELNEKNKKGELKSFVSYTNPIWFYFIYALIVGIYTMLGGFRAAAITDSIQGVLIIIFSVILIPLGLSKIGGFSGLHASVPDYMFELFGSATMSDYAWYTIFAMVLANLVSIVAVAAGMQTAGSATNENTARFGMIVGMFAKRIIMIFWALAGLLAIAMYAGKLHDPDLIWGYMSRELLVPGAIGLMLVGILAANMSSLDAASVSYAALFIRNLYKPFLPDKTDKHYLFVGRVAIAITLLGGIAIAVYVDNLLELFKYIISVPAIFGASIWLGFVWRRLTKWAVIIQVFVCIIIYTAIPNLFQNLDSAKNNPAFLLETNPREVEITTEALTVDVNSGKADFVGQSINKMHKIEPVGIYYDKVVLNDPSDPVSSKVGLGRFHAEIWVLSWLGINFTDFSKAQLVAARFFFDALFPFLLLFPLSFLTKPVPKPILDRFFARMHTPVQKSPEEETLALNDSYSNPDKFEDMKIVPGSDWEILKPSRMDYIGFLGSWALVGLVIFLLWVMVSIR
ncbi:MAG: sodium:solute symporter family protein [Candidatus Electryonea clarkiae]|nr:sodium:solute symporter family protein [Candidatus Electryonea clarkiae]MDP8289136.1 sodium:solute symporter family protein [Candidatus Electryonea clarkiae]